MHVLLAIALTVALISHLPWLIASDSRVNDQKRDVEARPSNGGTANGETAAEGLPAYEKTGVELISIFQDKGG